MTRTTIFAALAGLALFGATDARAADLLGTGGGTVTYTYGGWQVQIGGCSLQPRGGSSSSNCSSEQVIGTVLPSGALNLVYEGSTGGSLLTSGAANQVADLFFFEQITAPGGNNITSVKTHVTGTSSNPADLAADNVSITEISPNSASSNADATGLDSTVTITGLANVVKFTKDINSGTNGLSAGDTLSLDTVAQTFSLSVPEPSSLSLLAAGLLAVLPFRRRIGSRKA
jgi:hypothetical protein